MWNFFKLKRKPKPVLSARIIRQIHNLAKKIGYDECKLRFIIVGMAMQGRSPEKRYAYSCQSEKLAGLNGCKVCSRCVEGEEN